MLEDGFHFAHPLLLWLLLAPLPVFLWLRLTAPRENSDRYQAYAEARLLPFLLGRHDLPPRAQSKRWLAWSGLWTLLVIAIAGPRWDFDDVQLFRPGSDLVILLDLSRSMDLNDVRPTRLTRARQEIQDLVEQNHQTRLGLIGFATIAHIIAPLTEDGNSLRSLLPALSTDLVELKGSRLTEALIRAQQMLAGQPKDSSRHLLLISDGDFADANLEEFVQRMAKQGIHLHILGVGTPGGGPVRGIAGRPLLQPDGTPVISRLDEALLIKLAALGNGTYQRAEYRNVDTTALLEAIGNASHAEVVANQKTRVWRDHYFWLTGIAALLVLPMYRRYPREPVDEEAA